MSNRTLILVKPDAVKRGLVGRIIQRFEDKGFKLLDIKMVEMNREMAENFYSVHKGKPFFENLVSFITSGPVVAVIMEGRNAIDAVRVMIGSTDASKAAPGSVRGDFSLGLTDNSIHASDSEESFTRETAALGMQ
ncbi:MAG: nucleoside-diphosphate kinase [Nitrososphaerota archaeon]|jgi:nucleoside-diphosphate kinase|nr:nucleoside-diphosphate kinase [Nitrososphaerota archaeon]MDG6927981.1 nucleoside-diphosphate kinase [Nitrososphaerota archaeon]MDG6929650.1 nucleoside-diphosphate kinase [Nitrososphaerota archaeon]MDG6932841.1 nucleoside-diphosphate kinase [Nitrososphaerota archaeon]MDG6936836.1 nucleoside-diphosphate kinase [Nitrososphaerota archaeon]